MSARRSIWLYSHSCMMTTARKVDTIARDNRSAMTAITVYLYYISQEHTNGLHATIAMCTPHAWSVYTALSATLHTASLHRMSRISIRFVNDTMCSYSFAVHDMRRCTFGTPRTPPHTLRACVMRTRM